MIYTGIEDFFRQHINHVFRIWHLKKAWTPYDEQQCDPDISPYENDVCEYVIITECIPLPNGDFLLGCASAEGKTPDDAIKMGYVSYYKLSEIEFAYCANDQDWTK